MPAAESYKLERVHYTLLEFALSRVERARARTARERAITYKPVTGEKLCRPRFWIILSRTCVAYVTFAGTGSRNYYTTGV